MWKLHKKAEVSFVTLMKNGWFVLMKLSWIHGNGGELGATVMVEAWKWEGNFEEKLLKQGEMK